MKKIKILAIITTAICGFYFTSYTQTTGSSDHSSSTSSQNDRDQSDRSTSWQSGQSGDEISLSSEPDIEKSAQGYTIQVWVDPEDKASGSGISGRTGTSGSSIGTSGTTSRTTGSGTSGSLGTIGTQGSSSSGTTSGSSYGTTGSTGTSGSSGIDRTGSQNNQSGTSTGSSSTIGQGTSSSTDWRSSSNQSGSPNQPTALNIDNEKKKVYVKVVDESTGREVNAEDIEMKVTTPSKKSFTADLKEKGEHHMGELSLNESGTYNIQATIKTDDNKNVVIPFTYDSSEFQEFDND